MSTECGFCKGTGIEPGFTECVWCNNTGRDGGIQPDALKKALAPRFTKGDTDPVGDCDKFEAGINVGAWLQRIVVYGDSPADAEALRDELMALATERDSLKAQLEQSIAQRRQFADEVNGRLTVLDERTDALEQRNAELSAKNQQLSKLLQQTLAALNPTARLAKEIKAALNPEPEAERHDVVRDALRMENQRITPARFKCLACDEYHEGSGNLPCPKMTPYSGGKP